MSDLEEIRNLIDKFESIKMDISEDESVPEIANPIAMEDEEVIIEYFSSDNENVHMESDWKPKEEPHDEGTSEDRRKRTFDRMSEQQWEEFYRKEGYYKQSDKYRKIPPPYQPKMGRVEVGGFLNLDCILNPVDILQQWINQERLILQTTEEIRALPKIDYVHYLYYKIRGNVLEYLSHNLTPEEVKSEVTDNISIIRILGDKIWEEFVGGILTNEFKESQLSKARWTLSRMELCNICSFDEFMCQYQVYYYKLQSKEDREFYKNAIFQNMSYPLSDILASLFKRYVEQGLIKDSIGGIIQVIHNYIDEQCTQQTLKRQVKPAAIKCCTKFPSVPQKFGCPTKQFKGGKKYKKRFKPYKKRYKRQQKPYKKWKPEYRRKYYKPKGSKPKPSKAKYCPTGKSTCRCWICNEQGHYANDCPNKGKEEFKEKKKQLRIAQQLDLEPIEDDQEYPELYQIIELSEEDSEVYSTSEDESE